MKTNIAKLLKTARTNCGLSMRELAEQSSIPLSTISKLESGKLGNPTLATMLRLGEVVNIKPIEWFDTYPKKRKMRA